MATRLKPSRINVDNTPRVGDGAAYQNDNDFHWSMGGGDMSYEDFAWHTLTGTSLVIEDISNNITPSSNFTVSAGTVKPGIEYVLRVNTGNTPYTMTLGTGVTNPNSYKTELKPNTVNQFKFIATSTSQLELEGVDSAVVSEINWGEIDGTLSNQTDLQNALDQKLDKVTSTATNPRAYVVNADGIQATLPITDSATSGAIVRRNGTQITVPDTPSTNTDAASKKYVDDQVSAATAGAVSDTAYGSGWDGVTGIAPSKNAVYDKISAMDTTISGKANDSDVVKLTGDQTIAGTKTFSTSPVVPSKTTDATNTGTAIATEAQVYKKQDTLVSGTNIKTVNNQSLLGSGNISINGILSGAIIPPASATYAGKIWFDTMNNKFWGCDGTAWTEITPVLSVNGQTGAVTLTIPTVNNATLTIQKNGTNVQTFTANQSTNATANITVPTDTADLTNGAGYLTSSTGVTTVNGSHGAVTVNGFNPGGTATTGYVVTKTASGYEWQAPSGGIEVDENSPIQLTKIRAGSQSDYDNLSSYDSTTVYLTI